MERSEQKNLQERPFWIPPDLTDRELDVCNNLFKSYLFITPDKKGRDCTCSGCRKTYRVEKLARTREPRDLDSLWARHGFNIRCRECGRDVKVRWAKISHNPIWEEHCVVFVRQYSPDEIHLDCYGLCKGYGEGFFDLPPRVEKRAAYVLTPGNVIQYTRKYYWFCKNHFDDDPENWEKREKKKPVLEPFNGCGYRLLDSHLLSGSFLHYHGLDKWERIKGCNSNWGSVKYLALRAMYPGLEILLKAGYKQIVEGFVHRDRRYYNKLNLNGSTPGEIFGENRQELAVLRSMHEYMEQAMVMRCKKKKRDGWLLSDMKRLMAVGDIGFYAPLNFCDKHKTSPRDLERYLQRQLARRLKEYEDWCASGAGCSRSGGGIAPRMKDVWNALEDYHRIAEAQGKRAELFPKNVFAAHDALVEERRAAEIEKEAKANVSRRENWIKTTAQKYESAKKFDQQYEQDLEKRLRWRIKHLSFAEGDFMTVIPSNSVELVREGEMMHHCVGTYAERYVKGLTNIVFLRHKDHLDKPMLTAEIHNDGVMYQCYGFNDDRPLYASDEWKRLEKDEYDAVYDAAVREFAEHYKAYLQKHFEEMQETKQKKVRTTA